MTDSTQQTTAPVDLHLNDVGAMVTAAVALAFVAGVASEWAFVTALGLSLADVPLMLEDFTKSALVWLTPLVAVFMARVTFGLVCIDDRALLFGHRQDRLGRPCELCIYTKTACLSSTRGASASFPGMQSSR